MNDQSTRPFGVKDQVGYVFGDMAGSFVNLFVDAYILYICAGDFSGMDGGDVFGDASVGRG